MFFSLYFFICMGALKAVVLDDIPDLPLLVDVLVYYTKPVHFLSTLCIIIKCVHKKWQVYDPRTQMVRDTQFLYFNVNDSYYYNMILVDLSYQLWNVYQVDHWIHKHKWRWYIFSWVHGIFLFNPCIILKTLCEEVKMNPMSCYDFQCLVFMTKIDPTNFGGRDHLISAVQC